MIPIAAGNEIKTLRTGNQACREIWAVHLQELYVAYSIFLLIILFILPLCTMAVAYGAMAYKLWFSIKQQAKDQEGNFKKCVFLAPKTSEGFAVLMNLVLYDIHLLKDMQEPQNKQIKRNNYIMRTCCCTKYQT